MGSQAFVTDIDTVPRTFFDLSRQPSGVYLLRLVGDRNGRTVKIVKR